jgi:hypothetical protein
MRRLSSSSSFFCPVLCFILLLLIITIIFWQPGSDWLKKKEGYSNLGLNPGAFPLMVDQPLLFNDYKVQTQPGESGLNASDIYVNYPIFPATSMQNNNIRYWTRPTNGTCTPPEMCGGLYEKTAQNIPPLATPPGWNINNRDNFYAYFSGN